MHPSSDSLPRPPLGSRLARRGLIVVALLVMVAVAPTAIDAQEDDKDPREKREEVRQEQAETASEVDALEAESAEIMAALADIEADVRAQEAILADAEAGAAAARSDAELASQRVADTEALLTELEDALRELAVDSYVTPPADQAMSALERDTAADAEERQALLELRTGDAADVIDRMKETRSRLDAEREEAEFQADEAERQRDVVKAETAELQVAYERQAAFAAEVESRLDARLAEAAALEELDKELSEEIARKEAELAAKLKAQEEARKEAARKASAAASAARAASATSVAIPAVVIPTDGEIVTISNGIQIHRSIAAQVDAMIQAAAADGLTLSGGGYRSAASQISLRKAHCGTSHYAIYEASPSSCSPPTARPGASNHERGLAIDFRCNGASMGSRSSPCYSWLSAHAAAYGMKNLPSEPWHWSVNGK